MGDPKKPDLHLDYAATLIDLAQFAEDHPELDMAKHIYQQDQRLLNLLAKPEMNDFASKPNVLKALTLVQRVFGPSPDPKFAPLVTDEQVRTSLRQIRSTLEELDHTNDPAHRYDIERRMDSMHLDNDIHTDLDKVLDTVILNDPKLADLYGSMLTPPKEVGNDRYKLIKNELTMYALNQVLIYKFLDQKRETTQNLAENYVASDATLPTAVQKVKPEGSRAPGAPSPAPVTRK